MVQILRRSLSTKRSVSCLIITTPDTMLTTRTVEPETAPSGFAARGHYKAVSKFVDDDDHVHLQFEWSFDIKKDWS